VLLVTAACRRQSVMIAQTQLICYAVKAIYEHSAASQLSRSVNVLSVSRGALLSGVLQRPQSPVVMSSVIIHCNLRQPQ